jgi:hypothetical protein
LTSSSHPDYGLDMSTFGGWPEHPTYRGVEGLRAFLAAWLEPWDDYEFEVEELHDAGDKVVAVVGAPGSSRFSVGKASPEVRGHQTFRCPSRLAKNDAERSGALAATGATEHRSKAQSSRARSCTCTPSFMDGARPRQRPTSTPSTCSAHSRTSSRPSELTLIEAGREDLVRDTRVAFQDATRDEFVAIVEQVTGRRVRAFHSQIGIKANTASEVFLFEVAGRPG